MLKEIESNGKFQQQTGIYKKDSNGNSRTEKYDNLN